ncbi:protein FAR-RED IMPAIRED RESPONSE 1-like [Mercurialis annua]|uniref:protein FAR-RED IMPAIRED RESPONSE 1-like n=1 Tax=Mercurialis annua TaxID=3986 RepID=UPI00215DDD1A|nr:protein FAR-RED IMPAIRED RESPONSE 1-like [Mercurialis annua]
MHQINRDFFHLMEVSDAGRLLNVMWIHPRSKAAYEEFHDVVSFDTTYLVNKYRMPFATVVGINHHGQSILLGCALVTHEDIRSFKWLFSNWLEAMGGIHPHAILTDQCESIKAATREVMPNTIHRFCLWHIMCKLPQKLKNVPEFGSVSLEFKTIIYESLTVEIFETNWNSFITRRGLENNDWLIDLYDKRESWVPVFLHHYFWQECSTLKQFVEQYEVAITDKLHKELLVDFESKNKIVKCISDFSFESWNGMEKDKIFKTVQNFLKKLSLGFVTSGLQDMGVDAAVRASMC